MENPFQLAVSTAELPADKAVKLFSNVFSEFNILLNPGNTFLNGARGSGKTTMFRLMRPDCYSMMKNCKIEELNFLGLYVGIKDTHLKKTDLGFLKNRHAESMINEHLLVTHLATKIFSQLSSINFSYNSQFEKLLVELFNEKFISYLLENGFSEFPKKQDLNTGAAVFKQMALICEMILKSFSKFERSLLENINNISYSGILLSYSDFLFPIIENIRSIGLIPQDAPIYLLIDDADNLTTIQKKILNTWISYRDLSTLCFKISTQLNYNQFRTLYGDRIETPHDYSEINIADRYTSSKGFYKKRVIEVVKKRLEYAGIVNVDPDKFFPADIEQEEKLQKKKELYISRMINNGKSEGQAYDYAYRYVRPDYIRDDLKGNRSTYSYAGFDQLVNISSGNMRQFIEPAKMMFDEMIAEYESKSDTSPLTFISPKIQDSVIRKYSTNSFYQEFEKLLKTTEDNIKEETARNENEENVSVNVLKKERLGIEKLRNLIDVLGNTFSYILLSNVSERRVFSIAIQDEPDEELGEILRLGVELGYFQKYVIGNKFGTGKAYLYILNRILAPHFGLDPSSFAGYKFVKSFELLTAIENPLILKRKIREKGVDSIFDKSQPSLFKEEFNENL